MERSARELDKDALTLTPGRTHASSARRAAPETDGARPAGDSDVARDRRGVQILDAARVTHNHGACLPVHWSLSHSPRASRRAATCVPLFFGPGPLR
jgi:hypothetical protein